MTIPVYKGMRKEPMSGMAEPGRAVKYARPTDKSQYGKPANLGYDINNYGLPVIDVQTERRNFPGYTEAQLYSMEDILQGDPAGTTETDSATDQDKYEGQRRRYDRGYDGNGYTKINRKQGPTGKWNSKRS